MNWLITGKKVFIAAAIALLGFIASNPEIIFNFMGNWKSVTIGEALIMGLVALSDWLKHRNDDPK